MSSENGSSTSAVRRSWVARGLRSTRPGTNREGPCRCVSGGVHGLVQVCAPRGSEDGRAGRARLPPYLVRQGGYARSTAEPGTGKRVATRLLAYPARNSAASTARWVICSASNSCAATAAAGSETCTRGPGAARCGARRRPPARILNAVFAGDPSRHLPSPLTSPVCSSTCCKAPAIRRRYPRSEHDGRDRVAPGHGPLCGARSLRFGDVAHGVSLRPRSRPVTLGVHGGGHRHGCA